MKSDKTRSIEAIKEMRKLQKELMHKFKILEIARQKRFIEMYGETIVTQLENENKDMKKRINELKVKANTLEMNHIYNRFRKLQN